jgi:methylated-DNA-[protein]-cysteine S-methyltransferase
MNNSNKRSNAMICYARYRSPLGSLILISDGSALTGLTFAEPVSHWVYLDNLSIFNSVSRWLDAYFAGTPGPVDFPLSPSGTEFQRRVWQILLTIPYGETVTYGTIAKQLDADMSAQAVGQAVGKNPIAVIIPCHRVVGAGGKLTGYAWGIERKQWLLGHEEETK